MTAPNFLDGLFGSGVQLGATAGADIGGGAGINGAAITAAKSDHTHRVGGVFAGATALTFGAVADGEFVKRVGSTLVSAAVSAGLSVVAASALATLEGPAGTVVVVSENMGLYQWQLGTVIAVRGAQVVASVTGRWSRIPAPVAKWCAQAAWHINPSTGNDYAVGDTSGTAIKTFAELGARINGGTLWQNVTVNLLGSALEMVQLDVNLWAAEDLSSGYTLTIVAPTTARTAIATGTVTTWVSQDPATNVFNTLTMSNTRASLASTTARVRFTSGAANGATASRNTTGQVPASANAVFLSNPVVLSTTPTDTPATVVPSAADTFVWEELPSVLGLDVKLRRPMGASNGLYSLIVHGIYFPDEARCVVDADEPQKGAWIGECDFKAARIRGPIVLVNARARSVSALHMCFNTIRGGMWSTISACSYSGFPLTITHSPYVNNLTPVGTYEITGTCAVLNAFSLTSANNAKAVVTDRIFGVTTADYAGVIEAGCQLLCTGNRPTATGAVNEVLTGATASTWAAATTDTARLCGVSVSP